MHYFANLPLLFPFWAISTPSHMHTIPFLPPFQERNGVHVREMLRFADSASCCECDPGMPYLGQTSQPGSSRIMWESTGRTSTCWRRRWIRRLSGSTGVAWLIKHSLVRQLGRDSSAAQQFWNIHRPAGTLSQLWHDWITVHYEILTLVPSRVCIFFCLTQTWSEK